MFGQPFFMELPQAFIDRLQQELGSFADQMCSTIAAQATNTSLRINTGKVSLDALAHLSLDRPIPWCKDAYFLTERPSFTLDPVFQAGGYYVQEASSMVLSAVLEKLPKPSRALDLCAAPGGKSLILLDHLRDNGFLIANEIVPKRAQILQENIEKWGSSRVSITSSEPKPFGRIGLGFDCILVDAPCSGEGLFGKDEEAIRLWHPNLPAENAHRQKNILTDILPALEPGGHLIYSTCTYGKCENEDVWLWLVEQGLEPVTLDFPLNWGFVDANTLFPEVAAGKAYRALPGYAQGLGFFICVFKKPGVQPFQSSIEVSSTENALQDRVNLSEGLAMYNYKNQFYYAAAPQQQAYVSRLAKDIMIIHPGGAIGHINEASEELIPAHGLACSLDLDAALPTFKLPPKQALWYLARKDFQPVGLPAGYFKVVCNDLALGWGFNKKGRFINCFPAQLKIRMKL